MRRYACLALGLVAWLGAAALVLPPDATAETIHPGARVFSIRRADGPLAIDGVIWDTRHPNLKLRAAGGGGDRANVAEAVSRHMARLVTPEQRPIAGCNADFFDIGATNVPSGLFAVNGELLTLALHGQAFAVLEDGSPRIAEFASRLTLTRADGTVLRPTRLNHGRGPDHLVLYTPRYGGTTKTNDFGVEVPLDVPGPLLVRGTLLARVAGPPVAGTGALALGPGRFVLSGHGQRADALRDLRPGETLTIDTGLTPDLPVYQAVGGWPPLLRDGQAVYTAKPDEPRHPRTIMGYDADQAVMVIVDGRRAGHSIGLTMPQLVDLMREFGCTDALNLDGGGSSTCWVRGTIRNRPSDGRERGVPNSLALLDVGPLGPPARLALHLDGPPRMVPGARLKPIVDATDERLNPLGDEAGATLSVDGDIGRIENGEFIATTPGIGRLIARIGATEEAQAIEVIERPAALRLAPTRLELLSGESAEVIVEGLDAAGRPVRLPAEAVTWEVPAGLAALVDGKLIAGDEGRSGNARATALGVGADLPIAVAGPRPLETFETDAGWTFLGFPESVQGGVTAVPGLVGRAARLTYQLGTEPATRAAYVRLDRELPAPLGVRFRYRGDGRKAWIRVAIVDGNGSRTTYDAFDGDLPGEWRTVTVPLPPGLRAPVQWQSVYVVATDASYATDGWVEFDQLEVLTCAAGG